MKNLEKKIYKHLKERGWHELRPSDIAKSIMIEGAELLELFQWENRSLAEVKKDKKKVEEVKEEIADVLIYAIELTALLGIDTEKAILKKLALTAKKYPAAVMKKNAKAGSGSGNEAEYWRIKKAYRAKKNAEK